MSSTEDQRTKARRRQWFVDRAAAIRIKTEGSRLVAERMDEGALWTTVVGALLDLEDSVALQARPEQQRQVQDALKAALELKIRGSQLQLPLD